MKPVIWIFTLLLLAGNLSAQAKQGTEVGNGGDICEDRFNAIRDDISTWLSAGGPDELNLPSGLSESDYISAMRAQITAAKVSCTDEVVTILIDGKTVEKSCKNFTDADGAHIVCNRQAFLKDTNESDQYVLVHHEYAGLAGFEVNENEESHYNISNQISDYLVDAVVKKLAVKKEESGSCLKISDPGIQRAAQAIAQLELAAVKPDLEKKNIHADLSTISVCFSTQLDWGTSLEIGDNTAEFQTGMQVRFSTTQGTALTLYNVFQPMQVQAQQDATGEIIGYNFFMANAIIGSIRNTQNNNLIVEYSDVIGSQEVLGLTVADTILWPELYTPTSSTTLLQEWREIYQLNPPALYSPWPTQP